MSSIRPLPSPSWQRRIPGLCACFALATAIVPFARAFFRVEVNYNEGWNIYNASTVANHQLLYPVKYAWTTVNYPMLSFFIFAQLHRLTHDYLFTARAVSLASLQGICTLPKDPSQKTAPQTNAPLQYLQETMPQNRAAK